MSASWCIDSAIGSSWTTAQRSRLASVPSPAVEVRTSCSRCSDAALSSATRPLWRAPRQRRHGRGRHIGVWRRPGRRFGGQRRTRDWRKRHSGRRWPMQRRPQRTETDSVQVSSRNSSRSSSVRSSGPLARAMAALSVRSTSARKIRRCRAGGCHWTSRWMLPRSYSSTGTFWGIPSACCRTNPPESRPTHRPLQRRGANWWPSTGQPQHFGRWACGRSPTTLLS
mmetsp:Transcript_34438/g.87075  ORF Transcript_34438/g.87075 Transcript_34438/m.87075 type:complete len:225 (-) Transcript_34438:701-1375(-)